MFKHCCRELWASSAVEGQLGPGRSRNPRLTVGQKSGACCPLSWYLLREVPRRWLRASRPGAPQSTSLPPGGGAGSPVERGEEGGGQPSLARREGPCEGCSVCGDCGSLESFAQCFLRAFSPQFQQLSCQHMTFKTVEKEPLLGMCSWSRPSCPPASLGREPAAVEGASLGAHWLAWHLVLLYFIIFHPLVL